MEATRAIALVSDWIRSRGLDYPTEGLEADRFEAGWSVYAPVEVDESDPMAFLEMPVGRSVFLVGDSGRIEEVSSSVPPLQAQAAFAATELGVQGSNGDTSAADFMAEFERQFHEAAGEDAPVASFTVVDAPPEGPNLAEGPDDDAAIAEEASRLIEPIVQQLAQLGPDGWEEFDAEFAFTVSSQIAQLQFSSQDRTGLVPVPQSVAALVSRQREVAAQMPAGPWWRLILNVTKQGETTVNYDYGDEPFPEDQLVAPEHYRDDLEAYPRSRIPVWLAGYVAGPAAQSRAPRQAAEAAEAASAAVVTADLPPLPELRARWAVLSAIYAGVESGWGPRVFPGHLWYESDRRSGSTLFVLPGERAVLSGGKWDSELLEAAYNGGRPLPDLYTGAPAWVNDSALNTRIRNGLLSFCYWWADGQWHRGATDTSGELDAALPAVRTPDDTVSAMVALTGPGTEAQCAALLAAAVEHSATTAAVAAIFTNVPGADVAAAVNQLSLAGVLAG
ncbi:hypothetical protein SAMN04489835_4559 [Mycolicibacterium rutilum]|uniref:Uncharacterized protein n=1 Tax=Mycolicibacterium rutilum TaxID=370526 RepID=A0A1H6L246_MYCRU|nr:hypothetical protein [Mycolicibacterium rutilum]SEH82333.1 hypothetical protein SAMN04489835_4559 [Mycolicibacterium rutilum]